MIPEPDVLEEVGQLQVSDLETLAVGDLAKLIDRVTEAKERARNYEHLLQSAMNHRFSQRAHHLRQEVGKTTGTVRFQEEGFVVIADLPKKPEYDQRKLKEAVEALRKWGENPEDYVSLEIKVSETKYNAWPPGVRQLFEPARTLKVGKPTYKLEQLKPGAVAAAANDSIYCEEH